MGATTSIESAGQPTIVSERAEGDQDVFSQFIQQLDDLEKLVPVTSSLEDLSWNDLRFLAEAGSNPEKEAAQKRLEELWKLIADWHRNNARKVESGQNTIWLVFEHVRKLARDMKHQSKALVDACGATNKQMRNLATLKSTSQAILEDVEDLSARVEKLSEMSAFNKQN